MKVKPSARKGKVLIEVGRRDESIFRAAAQAVFRLKTILVPFDFSPCSKKAAQYALALAEQHSAAVTLLHAVAPPPYTGGEFSFDATAVEQAIRDGAKNELAGFAKKNAREGVKLETAVRTGAPLSVITQFAQELPADLIVIATHGRTGLSHILLGSVAESVVRHAPCPVLVVREREHDFIST